MPVRTPLPDCIKTQCCDGGSSEFPCDGYTVTIQNLLAVTLSGSINETIIVSSVDATGDREWRGTKTLGCGLKIRVILLLSSECTFSYVVDILEQNNVSCLTTGPSQPFPTQTIDPVYLYDDETGWAFPGHSGAGTCGDCQYDYPDVFSIEVTELSGTP